MKARAERIAKVRDTWRVYFPDMSIGSRETTRFLHLWVKDNCAGPGYVRMSHVRFPREDDALLFWMTFR
jgi:monoamine oxidase